MTSLDAVPRTRLGRRHTLKDESSYRNASGIKQEFEFFVSTSKPHQPEGSERGLIRRLVMRNFFEAKGAGLQTNTSESNSANTVMSRSRLKNRFRLAGPRKDGKDESKEEATKVKRNGAKASRRSCRAMHAKKQTEERMGSSKYLQKSGKEQSRTKIEVMKYGSFPLCPNPNTHRVDPFDVLPIPGTLELDTLFKLYKYGSRKNSIPINAKHTWWSFISTDAGLLHATLATWALYGMLVKGLSDLHIQQLRHKNEAIKEINTKLGSPGCGITDELVGTVVTMASFENILGAYSTAQLHMAALKRMIATRGGLHALAHNDGLMRGIIWTDFHISTVFCTPPSFAYIRFKPVATALPNELLEEAAYTSPTSLLQLDVGAIECFNIFYRLHRLSLAMCEKWVRRVDGGVLSDMLYETEYAVLNVHSDYASESLADDYDYDHDHNTRTLHSERYARADARSIVEAILAATQIFIYAALRDIPTNTKIFSILLQRLRSALDPLETNLLLVWRSRRNLNMLLWVLVVASSMQPPGQVRTWWIVMIADVCGELGIESQEGLEMVLRHVAWVDTWFDAYLGGIWDEVASSYEPLSDTA